MLGNPSETFEKVETPQENEENKVVEETKKELNVVSGTAFYKKLFDLVDDMKTADKKEKKEMTKEVKDFFAKNAEIVYQDQTGGVEIIKDIDGFFNKVRKGKIRLAPSVSFEQYVEEGAIDLVDEKGADGKTSQKIKRIQLNSDYLE